MDIQSANSTQSQILLLARCTWLLHDHVSSPAMTPNLSVVYVAKDWAATLVQR